MATTKRQKEAFERLNNYMAYATRVDVHQVPTKGVNSGANGRAFEQAVKVALHNYRSKGITAANRADTIKKIDGVIQSIEIKQGAGELATLNEYGEIVTTIFKRDLIVYAPEYEASDNVLQTAYVMSTNTFMKVLDEAGLIRYKKTSSMTKRDKEEQYNDRMAIQTFTNSQKKLNLFYDLLEENGAKLGTWLKEKGLA